MPLIDIGHMADKFGVFVGENYDKILSVDLKLICFPVIRCISLRVRVMCSF